MGSQTSSRGIKLREWDSGADPDLQEGPPWRPPSHPSVPPCVRVFIFSKPVRVLVVEKRAKGQGRVNTGLMRALPLTSLNTFPNLSKICFNQVRMALEVNSYKTANLLWL